MRKLIFALIVAAATAAIIVPLAMAGGNSINAQACQQGGYQNLARQDGTGFANTSDCVSYAAHGGILYHSENFSEMKAYPNDTADPSMPTTWKGGTIDFTYGDSYLPWYVAPGVLSTGSYFTGLGPNGTHFLFTGLNQNTAKFTFTNPAQSVQVTAESDKTGVDSTLTLTGYDASNHVVKTASIIQPAMTNQSWTLKIDSASANIKYFTISTDDQGYNAGLGISNILWG
jgi:hypothetical protein